MIMSLPPGDSRLAYAFIEDVKRLPMDKRAKSALSKLQMDLKSGQVNSQRFMHTFPIVQQSHNYLRTLVAQTFHYSRLPRLSRLLLLPALYQYLTKMLPARIRHNRQLDRVAVIFQSLEQRATQKGNG